MSAAEPISKEDFLAQNKFQSGEGASFDNAERTEAMGILKAVRYLAF
jgi:hypothetical protein